MTTPPTILVVEDEPAYRHVLKEFLTQEGYDVTVAEHGIAALRYLARRVFDWALIDLNLPDIRGINIIKTIRLAAPDTTIIALTGYATSEMASITLQLGVYDYLTKPYPLPKLQESIHRGLTTCKTERQRREIRAQIRRMLGGHSGSRKTYLSN